MLRLFPYYCNLNPIEMGKSEEISEAEECDFIIDTVPSTKIYYSTKLSLRDSVESFAALSQ